MQDGGDSQARLQSNIWTVAMARRPSLDYHSKRMHSEYNDDDEEKYFYSATEWLNHYRWPARTRSLGRGSPWASWPSVSCSFHQNIIFWHTLPFEPHQNLLNIKKWANSPSMRQVKKHHHLLPPNLTIWTKFAQHLKIGQLNGKKPLSSFWKAPLWKGKLGQGLACTTSDY